MKKLMAVLLGLSFVLGSAPVSFAREKNTTKKQRKQKPRKAKRTKDNRKQ